MKIDFTDKSPQQRLLDSGYNHHECDMYATLHGTRHLYQKRITDDHGIRYFINAWYFHKQSGMPTDGVQMEVQYTDMFDDNINVCPLLGDKIEQSEKFFEEMWERMDFGYYEEWE